MKSKTASILLFVSSIAGCATVPSNVGGNFASVTQSQAASSRAFVGTQVRWGGVVVGSREVSNGECLEVAAYPLDDYYARPYRENMGSRSFAALFGKDVANYDSNGGAFKDKLPPRFLACGDARGDSDVNRVGAVLTLTGTLGSAHVFEVSDDACTPPVAGMGWQKNPFIPDYVGTLHASGGGRCVVSLPTLRVLSAYAWKEPPAMPVSH